MTPLHIHPANAFQDEPFTFSVEPAPAGHVIRFTLDGSEPTSDQGQIYQGPVKVARTRVVRAAAFAEGRRTSILATLYFTIDGADPRESGSSKPSDHAKTFQGAMPLAGSGIVKVRARLGETWSALVETTF